MRKRKPKRSSGAPPWQRRRRRVFVILTICAVILAFPLGWRFNLRAEVLREIADLRGRGEPVTFEDLIAWDKPGPDDAEVAAIYEAVFLAYREMSMDDFKTLPRLQGMEPRLLEVPFSPETLHALQKRVEGNEAMLQHLREASAFPRYRMIRSIDRESAYALKSLDKPLEVLFAQACVLAENGDGDAALDAISIGVKIARASRATPLNHVFNAVTELERNMWSAVFPVLLRAPVSQERLDELLRLASDPTWLEDLQRSIVGSRCLTLHELATASFAEEPFEFLIGEYDRHALWIIAFAEEAPRMASIPFSAWDGHLRERGIVIPFGYPFWWGTSPSEALDPVVLAVLRHRQAHGALPETLSALVPDFLPETPVDSATGEPLTLERDGASFSICGANRGGDSPVPCTVFRFER